MQRGVSSGEVKQNVARHVILRHVNLEGNKARRFRIHEANEAFSVHHFLRPWLHLNRSSDSNDVSGLEMGVLRTDRPEARPDPNLQIYDLSELSDLLSSGTSTGWHGLASVPVAFVDKHADCVDIWYH